MLTFVKDFVHVLRSCLEIRVNILQKCSMPQLNYPIAIMNLYVKSQLHMPQNNQLQNDKLVEHNAHTHTNTFAQTHAGNSNANTRKMCRQPKPA